MKPQTEIETYKYKKNTEKMPTWNVCRYSEGGNEMCEHLTAFGF